MTELMTIVEIVIVSLAIYGLWDLILSISLAVALRTSKTIKKKVFIRMKNVRFDEVTSVVNSSIRKLLICLLVTTLVYFWIRNV